MYVYGGVYVYYMWVYAYVHQYSDYNVITVFNFSLIFFIYLYFFSLSFDLLAQGLGDCSLKCEKLKIKYSKLSPSLG